MKQIFLMVAFFATVFVQNSIAQGTTPTSPLLSLYYNMKDALVADNAQLASAKATEFVKAFNLSDSKMISQESRDALLKDATHISTNKDIKHQREHFANFSTHMFALAKASKLSSQPVYQLYCPMKKSSWLSGEKAVKNPYYGSSMLTCGNVAATL